MMNGERLKNYINGSWVDARRPDSIPVTNPATGEQLAQLPVSGSEDVDDAVRAAKAAFESWRQVPPVERARYLFRYKQLLDENKDELANILTREHGKTLREAQGSIKRGIENVEHACGIPTLMMGESLEDIATGIDTRTVRQPRGVYAAVTPYNFPAMVPLWFWPYAVATGNTFVVKPSEQVPITQQFQFDLIDRAGFPKGVLNMVHGTREVVESFADHPDITGVSFVGSSPVARAVYERASANGKRVQAFGGAKNHVIVMPDAHLEKSVDALVESAFGCAGQRCLAASVALLVGDDYDRFRDAIVEKAKSIKLGNGLQDDVDMGPVISGGHRDKVLSYIEQGIQEGAKLLLDGRNAKVEGHPNGEWVGPTIFEDVTPDMRIVKEEIFGPVLGLRRVANIDEAIAAIRDCEFANATTIFTSNGGHARRFQHEAGVSMMGINIGVAAPMAFFPFGGTKQSFFGDLKAHGQDSIRFFTDAKVVISRWF